MSCIEKSCLGYDEVPDCKNIMSITGFIQEFENNSHIYGLSLEIWIAIFSGVSFLVISIIIGVFCIFKNKLKKPVRKNIFFTDMLTTPSAPPLNDIESDLGIGYGEDMELVERITPGKIIGYNQNLKEITTVKDIIFKNQEMFYEDIYIGNVCFMITFLNKKFKISYDNIQYYNVMYLNETVFKFKKSHDEERLIFTMINKDFKLGKNQENSDYEFYFIKYRDDIVLNLSYKGFIKIINKDFKIINLNLMYKDEVIISNMIL